MRDELRARGARRRATSSLARVGAARRAASAELGVGPRPHKYVIVATGNIYDDVEQARAAAQAGADVIAVDPLHRAVAARLRARTAPPPRATAAPTRRRRTSASCARRSTRSRRKLRRYVAAHELLLRPVHAGDRVRRGVGAAGHAPQRRDVRDPLPRHQHAADVLRSVLLAPHLRARRHRHQHRRGQLHHHRRRLRGGAHRHRLASSSTRASPSAPGLPDRLLGLGHSFEIDPRARGHDRCASSRRRCSCARCFPDAPHQVHAAHEAQAGRHLLQPRVRRDGGRGRPCDAGRASSCSA